MPQAAQYGHRSCAINTCHVALYYEVMLTMYRRHLLLTATLLGLIAGISAVATQLPRPAGQSNHMAGRVSVRMQPDAPLRINSVEDESDDPQGAHVDFMVENVSGRPVRAYWISNDTEAQGMSITLGFGVNAHSEDMILQPGKSHASNITNPGKARITLWVNFVEFADGTTWGADTTHYAESLAGERAGARAEAERLLNLLMTSGPQAVIDSIARRDAGDVPPPGHSTSWTTGFRMGVKARQVGIQRAYSKNNLAAVEVALRQPYDMSEHSPH